MFRAEGLERFGSDFYLRNAGAPFKVEGRTEAEPTFWEFVQSIIREGKYNAPEQLTRSSLSTLILCQLGFLAKMGVKETLLGTNDRHWTPVYLQCNLCHTTFQFILTLETLQKDETAIFSYFNISNKLQHRTSNR